MKRDRRPEMRLYEWDITRWMTSRTRMELHGLGRGVYRDLLDLCMAQGKMPADHELLAQHCAVSGEEFESVWPVIARHFHQDKHDKNSLVNDSATVERMSYFRFVAKQRKNRNSKGMDKPKQDKEIHDGGSTVVVTNARPLLPHDTTLDDTTRHDTTLEEKKEETEPPPESETPAATEEEPGMVIRSTPAWKTDPEYMEFVTDYLKTGGAFIDEDFLAAHTFTWRTLDPEQKLERHKALLEKITRGHWNDPRYVPKPDKFLTQEWKRPTIVARGQTSRIDQVKQLAMENLQRTGRLL